MVRQCWVCKTLDYLNLNLTFHRFPFDKHMRRLYLLYLNIEIDVERVPTNALICSSHFLKSDFEYRGINRRKFLKKEARPIPVNKTSNLSTQSSSDSTPKFTIEGPPPKSFPKSVPDCDSWKLALNLGNINSANKFVCSDHFCEADYILAQNGRLLKSTAVPHLVEAAEPISIPKYGEIREKWLKELSLGGDAAKNKFVCSEHFDDNDFIAHSSRTYLRCTAVPTRGICQHSPSCYSSTELVPSDQDPLETKIEITPTTLYDPSKSDQNTLVDTETVTQEFVESRPQQNTVDSGSTTMVIGPSTSNKYATVTVENGVIQQFIESYVTPEPVTEQPRINVIPARLLVNPSELNQNTTVMVEDELSYFANCQPWMPIVPKAPDPQVETVPARFVVQPKELSKPSSSTSHIKLREKYIKSDENTAENEFVTEYVKNDSSTLTAYSADLEMPPNSSNYHRVIRNKPRRLCETTTSQKLPESRIYNDESTGACSTNIKTEVELSHNDELIEFVEENQNQLVEQNLKRISDESIKSEDELMQNENQLIEFVEITQRGTVKIDDRVNIGGANKVVEQNRSLTENRLTQQNVKRGVDTRRVSFAEHNYIIESPPDASDDNFVEDDAKSDSSTLTAFSSDLEMPPHSPDYDRAIRNKRRRPCKSRRSRKLVEPTLSDNDDDDSDETDHSTIVKSENELTESLGINEHGTVKIDNEILTIGDAIRNEIANTNQSATQNQPAQQNLLIKPCSKRRSFRYIGDATEEDMEDPVLAKQFRILVLAEMKKKNKRIEYLRQESSRCKEKIAKLKIIIRELTKKKTEDDCEGPKEQKGGRRGSKRKKSRNVYKEPEQKETKDDCEDPQQKKKTKDDGDDLKQKNAKDDCT